MKTRLFFPFTFILVCTLVNFSFAENPKEDRTIHLFGSKPIQLSVGANGISQNKAPGFICDLDASLGGGHYSEWGQTEEDARSLVTKKCSDRSGILLCKRDKAICKSDK